MKQRKRAAAKPLLSDVPKPFVLPPESHLNLPSPRGLADTSNPKSSVLLAYSTYCGFKLLYGIINFYSNQLCKISFVSLEIISFLFESLFLYIYIYKKKFHSYSYPWLLNAVLYYEIG